MIMRLFVPEAIHRVQQILGDEIRLRRVFAVVAAGAGAHEN